MLAKWTEILPLFMVRWLARRKCERMQFRAVPELKVVMARPDVLFKLPSKTTPSQEAK